jgi:hypothetical protein
MNAIIRPLLLVLALLPAPFVAAQALDEPVRLRLSLDPDGRVHLSTEAEPALPPSLRAAPLPIPGAARNQRNPGWGRIALQLESTATDPLATPSPCLVNDSLHLRHLRGCETATWIGLPGAVGSSELTLRLDHQASGFGVDLSYGLGWLETGDRLADAGGWLGLGQLSEAAASLLLPGWLGPTLSEIDRRSERLGVGAHLWLGPQLRLELSYGHDQRPGDWLRTGIVPSIMPWTPGTEDSLSLGIGYGRFQGALTGRQWRPDAATGISSEPGLDTLDLGFSWRMPWNAELEFGARNLIVRPQRPDTAKSGPEQGDLRTPYIRYHQDL